MKKFTVILSMLFLSIPAYAQEKHSTDELYEKVLSNIGETGAEYFSKNVSNLSNLVEKFYSTDYKAFSAIRNSLNYAVEAQNSGDSNKTSQVDRIIETSFQYKKNGYTKNLNLSQKELSGLLQFYRGYLQSKYLESDDNFNVKYREQYLQVLEKYARKKFGDKA